MSPGELTTIVLLSLHVVAAIVFIGPITAAASAFPRYGRLAVRSLDVVGRTPDAAPRVPSGASALLALHRISSGYAVPALAVPVFGIATALSMGILHETWLWASIALTVAAAALLGTVIVPGQRSVLRELGVRGAPEDPAGALEAARGRLRRLGMTTGVFALIWVVVVVLMIARPGAMA
ncbi:hypothetical protein WIS52_14055 [Pseudonocardia nematodicida]|uniref:Integral membrane protein DUF2269 n=1 Tax=Pseudonocardia nematodicida TaxID=1206997 RepID=A0ABV1KAU1_9PSEU